MRLNPVLLSLLALASPPVLACYTVYDRAGLVVYQGEAPPVDLSQPLHVALQKAWPGGHLVFDQATNCTPVGIAQLWRSREPHAPPNSIRRSGSAGAPVSAAPEGRPEPASPRDSGAGVTVITEMHTPPLVSVQRGSRIELMQN